MSPELVSSIPDTAAFGACFQCRTTADSGYVNTYRDTWEGDLVYCTKCAAEIGIAAGAVPKEVFEDTVQSQAREIRRLTQKLNKAKGRVKSLESISV